MISSHAQRRGAEASIAVPQAGPTSDTGDCSASYQFAFQALERERLARRSRAMNPTFLRGDKTVAPDEQLDAPAPPCPACGRPMWLNRFTRRASDDGVSDVRSYECRTCGALKDVVAEPAAI
jgi:hypothetical protein